MSEDCHDSEIKLLRPEGLVQERMQMATSTAPAVIHAKNAMGLILCRAPAGAATRRTQFVTCPDCRQKIDELLDAVFAPL